MNIENSVQKQFKASEERNRQLGRLTAFTEAAILVSKKSPEIINKVSNGKERLEVGGLLLEIAETLSNSS